LHPDNILNNNAMKNYIHLIDFEKEALLAKSMQITYSEKELNILNEINEASASSNIETVSVEEEIGLFGIKLSQFGKIQYIFIFIAGILTVAIVFGGLYTLTNKKKPQKKKKN
jgi:hypothetical protein